MNNTTKTTTNDDFITVFSNKSRFGVWYSAKTKYGHSKIIFNSQELPEQIKNKKTFQIQKIRGNVRFSVSKRGQIEYQNSTVYIDSCEFVEPKDINLIANCVFVSAEPDNIDNEDIPF